MVRIHQSKMLHSLTREENSNIKQSIATFRGDLASLTAPPFLLSSQSIVEFSAYWAEHPFLFVAPASEPDPEKRALLVLKWFLSTLKAQHNNKDENGKKKRMKPLNPFLGELFIGCWDDESGRTELVAEQVSHHPPATCSFIRNEKHGIRVGCLFLELRLDFESNINCIASWIYLPQGFFLRNGTD